MAAKKKQTPQGCKPAAKPKAKASPATSDTPREPEPVRLIIGDHELAQHYGVTTKSIYNWRLDGMPAKELPGNRWQYDLDRTDEWVESRRVDGEGDDETKALKRRMLEAKARSAEAKAEADERDNEIAERNVLDRVATELKLTEALQTFRDGMLRIPTFFHSHLCRKCQRKKEELKKQIEHELKELAKKFDELGLDEEES